MKLQYHRLLVVVAFVFGLCKGQSDGTTSAPDSISSLPSTTSVSVSSTAASPSSTSYSSALATYLDTLPACGASCLKTSLSAAQCYDKACLCSNTAISDEAAKCVKSACDFGQQLATKNSTEAACDRPPRDRSGQYNVTSITMCTVTGILVIIRLIFKLFYSYQRVMRSDDWVILISVLVGLPCTVLNTVGLTNHGLGKDVWTLLPSTITEFARYFFIQQILYLFLMTSIKISLLCFYLTIFPGRTTRRVLWITVAVCVAFGVSFIFLSIFQCTPIRFYWMQYAQAADGKCLNINLLGWINGAVSVGIDVWMIGIPLFQIKKLELHWKKKIGAAIMFLTGAFVTIVSILRLQSLLYFYSSSNPTWDLWHTAWWSTIEINIGLICACLPTIRLILVRMWPRVFGSTINSTMARSRASRGNSMMVRRQQVRIASMEIQLEEASSKGKDEQWETSPQVPEEAWKTSPKVQEEQWDNDFYHAK